MTASWIPKDPNAYLHPIHLAAGAALPVEWQNDYARWRHGYAPGFDHLVNSIFSGSSCSVFCRMAAPLEVVSARLIPDDLKALVRVNNPDDWDMLPDAQIRHVWNNNNVLFAKIVLSLTALQILVFVKNGKVKGHKLGQRNKIVTDTGAKFDANKLIEALESLSVPHEETVFPDINIHLAVYQFLSHDTDFWQRVIDDHNLVESFKNDTFQIGEKFLSTFKDGGLITIATSQLIKKWVDTHFKGTDLGALRYVHLTKRSRAASQEVVADWSRKTAPNAKP